MPKASVLVTALITDRPTCMKCFCVKSLATPARATLMSISRFVKVHRLAKARCRVCGDNGPTVSVDPPA